MIAAIRRGGAKVWLLGALLLLVPFVVPVPDELERIRVLRSFGVVAHFGLPMGLTLVLYHFGPLRGRLRAAALAAFVLAAGCEIPQFFVGRHPRLQDAGVDLAGVISAVGLILQRLRGRNWGVVLMVAGLAVLPIQLREMPGLIRGEALARERFPLLADFEDDRELVMWGENKDSGVDYAFTRLDDGQRVLSFTGEPADAWPGVILKGMPRDWSGYGKFVFEARVVDGEQGTVTVRLDDFEGRKDSAWCGGSFHLTNQWRRCELDLAAAAAAVEGRTFRLDDIDSLLLFTGRVQRRTVIQLDNISLE